MKANIITKTGYKTRNIKLIILVIIKTLKKIIIEYLKIEITN